MSARAAPLALALLTASACGGVATLADAPLEILVDEVENRDDAGAERREVIATFGHAACAILPRGAAVSLNGAAGVVLEPGGPADDGTQNCLQPIAKAPFVVDDDVPPVDGRLVVEDATGRVEVVVKDLITKRGFTIDMPATASEALTLSWSPAGQAPLTAAARLEQGGTSIALGPYADVGAAPALTPMTLSVADVPPGTYTLIVDATWDAELVSCAGARSCAVTTQHSERVALVVE